MRAVRSKRSILTVDVGGTALKVLVKGESEPRRATTGKNFTPIQLVQTVENLSKDWHFDCISIGFPGIVGPSGPTCEPGNLGAGWVGFDFVEAFGKPVKVINDATMQALGNYEGGRMLYLGLGTGLGSTFIAPQIILALELGNMHFDENSTLGEILGRQGLKIH